jgi:hypothetical protein
MSLLLDETTHRYTLDGRPLDGLTSTIAEAGLIGQWGDAWYLERGTAIHLATELWDKGILDEDTVDPRITGYLESWKRFRKDQGYNPTGIEVMAHEPTLLVATKIDRLPGPLDLKSGGPEPWHILQVGFQWACLPREDRQNPMDVYLDEDGGPPKVKSYTQSEMREAFRVYCSMLHFIRWRRERYGNPN